MESTKEQSGVMCWEEGLATQDSELAWVSGGYQDLKSGRVPHISRRVPGISRRVPGIAKRVESGKLFTLLHIVAPQFFLRERDAETIGSKTSSRLRYVSISISSVVSVI